MEAETSKEAEREEIERDTVATTLTGSGTAKWEVNPEVEVLESVIKKYGLVLGTLKTTLMTIVSLTQVLFSLSRKPGPA